MAQVSGAMRTIHHIIHGAATIYTIDAAHALSNFPSQWRDKPSFKLEEKLAYLKEECEAAVQLANESGKEADQAAADRLLRTNKALAEKLSKAGPEPDPVVEIPGDWQDGKASERIALAIRLGAERKGLTSAHADEFILSEIEKRAQPEAEPQQ